MLAPGFSEKFDKQYSERLKQRVEGLLQSRSTYHHEISPGLKIDFKGGVVVFEDHHQYNWTNNKKETTSVPEACEIIKQHVWAWLDYCMWPQEERVKTVAGLESFLEESPSG